MLRPEQTYPEPYPAMPRLQRPNLQMMRPDYRRPDYRRPDSEHSDRPVRLWRLQNSEACQTLHSVAFEPPEGFAAAS